MAHFEISGKGYQFRFYGKNKDNYEWSFAYHKEDRLAVVWGLNGTQFYANFASVAREFFEKAEIDAILCTMTEKHARFFKRASKAIFKVKDFGKAGTESRPMRWLLIRLV